MKFIAMLSILWLSSPAGARELGCDKYVRIEHRAVSTATATEFFAIANSSGTRLANRRLACLRNLNATAANHIWISTFQVTDRVSLALDTSKSWPVPGGNVSDAQFCMPLGSNIRLWVHTILGQGTVVAGWICE